VVKGDGGEGNADMKKGRPKLRGTKKGRITIAISGDLVRRVERMAQSEGRSRSDYIERVLEQAVSQDEVAVKALSDPTVGRALINTFSDPAVLQGLAKAIAADLDDDQLRLFDQKVNQILGTPDRAKGGKS